MIETSDQGATERRDVLRCLVAAVIAIPPAAGVIGACGRGDGRSSGMSGSRMPEWMMSGDGMMDQDMMRDMPTIHDLLQRHDAIRRHVDDLDGGIRTRTTSDDTAVAGLIRTHVAHMKTRIETGRAIRQMDPLFREIFEHHQAITMTVHEVPGGIEVTETSADPQVTMLIRQHARRAVSEFVAQGMNRAMQPTALPEGYHG